MTNKSLLSSCGNVRLHRYWLRIMIRLDHQEQTHASAETVNAGMLGMQCDRDPQRQWQQACSACSPWLREFVITGMFGLPVWTWLREMFVRGVPHRVSTLIYWLTWYFVVFCILYMCYFIMCIFLSGLSVSGLPVPHPCVSACAAPALPFGFGFFVLSCTIWVLSFGSLGCLHCLCIDR